MRKEVENRKWEVTEQKLYLGNILALSIRLDLRIGGEVLHKLHLGDLQQLLLKLLGGVILPEEACLI